MTSEKLQRSLNTLLRRRLKGYESLEYALTWSEKAMPSGLPICRLRASARRTGGSGCSGWPTPNAIPEGRGGLQTSMDGAIKRKESGHMLNLDDAVQLAGWGTPRATDGQNGGPNQDDQSALPPQASGTIPKSSGATNADGAAAGSRGALNPAFSLWLMGFPAEWESFAPQATRLSRKSRRNS